MPNLMYMTTFADQQSRGTEIALDSGKGLIAMKNYIK
jgi:hypothetical protein